MTRFSIASFNVKNLIGPGREYYRFEQYTPEEHAWKQDWLADQVLTLNADIIGFQEVFEEPALAAVIAEADARGRALNADVLPGRRTPYRRKAIFRKLAYDPYDGAALAFAPNANDGPPGQRRPGLAVLSRFGFAEPPETVQVLDPPLRIDFTDLGGPPAGAFEVPRLSRPIQKVRVPLGDTVISVFNCHFKSKLGEFPRPPGAAFPPEANLLDYDAEGRAMGAVRAGLRRMAEALVLRRLVLEELRRDRPVIVLGDLNDSDTSVSTEIVTGERPFRNYAWMRRHDAAEANDRYTREEAARIAGTVERLRLHSAEDLFERRALRDMVFTAAFGGVYESIDMILLSRHFHPDFSGRIGDLEYFSVLNDHLTDGSFPEAPYNKLASDHGQIMAQIRLGPADVE